MATSIRDLAIYESLSVVMIDGYKPKQEFATDENGVTYDVTPVIDLPGDANWFCEQFGMAAGEFNDAQLRTILWSDYDCPSDRPRQFSVLIATGDVDDLREFAEEAGYTIEGVQEVTEPQNFGDGNGTVEILKHRDGWVILS